MNKKEFILKILDIVQESRDMAPGLKILLENNALDDATIDTLVWVFREAAANTENAQTKQALEKSANMLEDIHEKEAAEHQKDLADLAELEEMFKNIW
jgi:hypothetical protein